MQKRLSEKGMVSKVDAISGEPEVECRPRTYSSREQLAFSAKFAAIVGVIVLLLWVLDRYT